MAGIGAGVGALIDYSVKGKTLVYRQPATGMTVAPVLLQGQPGIGIAVRF